MFQTFDCPACGGRIPADEAADTQVRCPLCQDIVAIPPPAAPPTTPGTPLAPGLSAPAGPVKQGLAIGALVCGILGLCAFPLGLVGAVLGIVALVKAGNEPHRYGGKGLAIGGICTGVVGIVLVPLILLPMSSWARENCMRAVCGANMRGIGSALMIYGSDLGNEYPPDLQVLISAGSFDGKWFCCPSSDAIPGDPHTYYDYIPGQTVNDDPRNVLLYEKPENHEGEGGNVLFDDGHVEFIKPYSAVLELVAETKRRIAERQTPEAGRALSP